MAHKKIQHCQQSSSDSCKSQTCFGIWILVCSNQLIPDNFWLLLLFVKMYRVEIDTNEFRDRVNLESFNENGRVQWLRHLALTQVGPSSIPKTKPNWLRQYLTRMLMLLLWTDFAAHKTHGLHQSLACISSNCLFEMLSSSFFLFAPQIYVAFLLMLGCNIEDKRTSNLWRSMFTLGI